MSSAADTILPILSAAIGVAFVYRNWAYRGESNGVHVAVRRVAPKSTVAEVEFSGEFSRSHELSLLVRAAEALRAAGFDAQREPYRVTVNWAARSMKEAA
ncbi:hypothetical protein BE21_02490 [Sorangium cellulosum]|uniref:Uncharacterized protein n=1 Tax=Sorangium cellulosum TaxID=56 RepID=A0A150TRV1_SORCE|nr:hypothetical protein BE21_02490 [Sorangium cellulosum]